MDAGLAAVIAGASGAGGAALAAFGTSFAMLRQAKIQRDSAHHLWLRNHQQQAFEELLIAVRRLKDLLSGPNSALSLATRADGSVDLTPFFAEHEVRSAAVAAGVARVALLADLVTGASAFKVGMAMSDLGLAELRCKIASPDAPTEDERKRLWDVANTASTDFALHAQQTLQKV
ncbi:hypothetical protein [Streptomyces sp. CA-256286]|uniref:hypothetical protein n=1 Tax=Streptomyces sp. CA-256286 TaxID=2801033 RepID=UPI001A987966|nr:hypothetical protein [Streptomyces sp. CA-256286]QTA36646.1 hypothetical protein JHY03_68610 [Streptomyces sp. CA-256286]